MSQDAILRFVDASGSVRLDLNSLTGWYLSRGLDLGRTTYARTYMRQGGVDGVTFVSADEDVVTMRIPLLMHPQPIAESVWELMEALRVECQRDTNIVEYRPPDFQVSFLIDTYKADVPSLHQGAPVPNPYRLRQAGLPVLLEIDRAAQMRGAGRNV